MRMLAICAFELIILAAAIAGSFELANVVAAAFQHTATTISTNGRVQ